MQGLSIRKVVACRERLAEKLNELNRLEQHDIDEREQPALPLPDAPDLEAARRAAADAYGQLLAALGEALHVLLFWCTQAISPTCNSGSIWGVCPACCKPYCRVASAGSCVRA